MNNRQTAAPRTRLRGIVPGPSVRVLIGALIPSLLVACGGLATKSDTPEPIPECEQYQKALAACTGQDLPISHETQMMPEDQRAAARSLCATNLRRIKVACR